MDAALFRQTATHLTRKTRRWDRHRRMITSLIWLPRGLIMGVLTGLVIAIIAWLHPLLMPEQLRIVAVLAVSLAGLGILTLVWGWPRSTGYQARYFDQEFDLKERISTALEISDGIIAAPDDLAEYQLNDAVAAADRVNVTAHLPLRVRWWEICALALLSAALVYLIVADNPQTDKLRAERELSSSIDNQIADIQQAIEDIENNSSLTSAEQEALTSPLEEALNILEQPDISQQEAIAALADAAEQLDNLSDGMSSDQVSDYQQAATELANSPQTSDLASAFQEPNLGNVSDSLGDLANDMDQMNLSAQEETDMANQLDQAAEQLEETNPELAEKLREAAEALRNGDREGAQEALREASELTQQQQDELADSPQANAAETARDQAEQSQRELADAGQQPGQEPGQQPPNQNNPDQTQVLQQTDQDSAEAPNIQQGELSQDQGDQPQQGEPPPGNSQQGDQPGAEGVSQMAPGGEPQSMPGPGQAPSDEEGQSQMEGDGTGDGPGGSSEEASDDPAGAETSNSTGSGIGSQQGGEGSDTTTGAQADQGEVGPAVDNPTNEGGGLQNYNPEFDSSTIGGQGNNAVNIGGDPTTSDDGQMAQEGEFGPNPSGESTLSYTGVYNEYQNIVSDALESGRIPLDQRDVIHDYFSSLDR